MGKTITKSSFKVLVRVRVRPGCAIFRHGRGWGPGQTVFVTAEDAERLEHHGTVELVRG